MKRSALWFWLGLALLLACAGPVLLRCLPGPEGRLGYDYARELPRLLAGDYFFAQNGPFVLPWFSPAFGAGLPYYAHPASTYVSLPQWLSFVFQPVLALQLTLLATLALAFSGTWLLCRRVFALSESSALLGATLFALDGFHSARLLIGHLGMHSSALAPLLAFFLLRPLPEKRRGRIALDALLAGLVLAYMFQSGNVHGIGPVLLAVGSLACLAALAGRSTSGFGPRLVFAGLVALVLCFEKLEGSLAYLASFPREGYPLPGARDAWTLVRVLFGSLFLAPPVEAGNAGFVGLDFALDPHEWDFSLGLVPLLVLGIAALRGVGRPRALPLALLGLLLALPFVLNLHGERWTPFLKSLPLLRSSSSLLRWFFAYVPFVAVLAALAAERLRPARVSSAPALAACGLALLLQLGADRSFYEHQPYDPRAVVEGWSRRADPPPIRSVVDPRGLALARDDALVRGESQLACIEPLFGYRLEWFPRSGVHAGDALSAAGGSFNFHDPRGFLEARPGAVFPVQEREALARFLAYGPLEGSPSSWTPALGLAALLLALALAWKLRRAA